MKSLQNLLNLITAIAFGFVVVFTLMSASFTVEGGVPADRPTATGSPTAIFADNSDCYREAPADMKGIIPSRVVYSRGDSGAMIGGPALVKTAFAQAFDGVDHGIRVHGFCR